MPALAQELVAAKVDVLAAIGGMSRSRRRSAATKTIPIVASDLETDPVAAGIAATLARPGGNVTGVYFDLGPDFSAKWMQLLKEAIPRLPSVVVLRDPAIIRSPQLKGVEDGGGSRSASSSTVMDMRRSLASSMRRFARPRERHPDAS